MHMRRRMISEKHRNTRVLEPVNGGIHGESLVKLLHYVKELATVVSRCGFGAMLFAVRPASELAEIRLLAKIRECTRSSTTSMRAGTTFNRIGLMGFEIAWRSFMSGT